LTSHHRIRGSHVTCSGRDRRAVGWAAAPIGRHSVMNGVALGGGVVPDEQQIERFAHRARGLFAQMDLIGDWAAESFRRNLVALGLDSRDELRVGEYAAAVERSRLRSIDAFDAMVTWLERRPARNGDDHRRR